MADKKLSELTQHHTTLDTDSRLYTVSDPTGTPTYGYTEYQDIRDQIDGYIGANTVPLDRCVYVAKNGIDATANGSVGKPFLTIQVGIDYAYTKWYGNISSANPVAVLICPGTYTENIDLTGKPYIDLLSITTRDSTIITTASGTTLTLGNEKTNVEKITIESTGGKILEVPSTGIGKEYTFKNCKFDAIVSNTYTEGIEINNGIVQFTGCLMEYTQTGTGGGTHKLMNIINAQALIFLNNDILMNVVDPDDDVIGIYEANIIVPLVESTSRIVIYRNGVVTGETIGYYANGTSVGKHLSAGLIILLNNGSGGDASAVKTAGNGCTIIQQSNKFDVSGFTNNWAANVALGDTINSNFETIYADQHYTGAGTYNYVNSPKEGDLQISGSYLNMYDQALTVGARGGDYTVIQDAIDSITTATIDKKHVILIYPGTYTENVVMKPYIDLKAVSTRSATVITSPSGTTLTLSDQTTLIDDIKIITTGGKILEVPAVANTINYKFSRSTLHAIINNSFTDAIEIKGGTVQFSNSFMHYDQTGTGGGTHRLINITGAGLITLLTTDMRMDVVSTTDDVVGVKEANEVITTIFDSSRLVVSRTGIVTGETIGYYANGTSADKLLSACFLQLLNEGSGGNASIVKTAGNGCVVTNQSNTVKVLNFTNNWSSNVGVGDTVYSNFDTITAAQRYTGSGTFNAIHAHSSGDLHVERDIVLKRNMEIGGTLALATGTTVNEITTSVTSSAASDNKLPTEKALTDHTDGLASLYVKLDGSTPFTGTVGGITPTLSDHLSTKGYVDAVAAGGGTNDLGPFVTKDAVAPSGGEAVGEKWIVAGLGGAWSGFDIDDIAEVDSITPTVWSNVTPSAGNHGWVTDEGIDYTFNGSDWVVTGTLIDHTAIQHIGTNSHAVIDTHIANVTTNPHVVTKTNVSLGNVTDDAQLKRSANDFNGFGEVAILADEDRYLIEYYDSGSYTKKYIVASNMYDRKVKVSATDTTQDYLMSKLTGSDSTITLTQVGAGGDEDLQIGYGTELTTLTDGSNADALHTHLSGWHGSDTRIKIAPAEFLPNDSKEWKQVIENDGGSVTDSEEKLTEFITIPIYIPTGYKATAYMVYASAAITVEIFENDITNNSNTNKVSGNANTEINMTDVTSSSTNYLSIVVVDAGADIYGAYVTIEEV